MTHSAYFPWNQTNSAHQRTHAIVIGAGIAGVSACYSLAKRGIKVTLIEQEKQAGAQASGNPAGLLMPVMTTASSPLSEYYIQAFNYSIQHAQTLAQSHSFGFKPSGIIQLAFNERQQKRQSKWLSMNEYSELVEPLNAEQVKTLSGLEFPHNGVLFKNAAWLSPAQFVAAHLDNVIDNVSTVFNQKVTKIQSINEEWHVYNANEELLAQAPVLVIANAFGVKEFITEIHLSLRTVRGQLSRLQGNASTISLKIPVSYDGYMVPAQSGIQWVGASFSNKKTKACLVEERHHNINQLQNSYPGFSLQDKDKDDISHDRAEFRCITSDYLPLVGPVPCSNFFRESYQQLLQVRRLSAYPPARYLPGLYLNTAHGSRGMISAPFASELLAREICGEPLNISTRCREHIHPARFLIRQLKKGTLVSSC